MLPNLRKAPTFNSFYAHSEQYSERLVVTFVTVLHARRSVARPEDSNPPRVAANSLRQYHEFMNLGFPEMIFIFLLALIIFGPKKLPEIGRQIGKALNEFKRASNEFKSQIESEINSLDVEIPRQTILPPARPPVGAIAAGSHESSPEVNSATKAPDA